MSEKMGKMLSAKELPVLLTVDVCDGSFDQGERKSRFTTLMDLVPEIRELVGNVLSERWGNLLPVTWFVRADMQVKHITGNALGLYYGWKSFWDEIEMFGGEVGWHPHLYKHQGQAWVPVRDPKKLRDAATRVWHEMEGGDWKPVTCRMGESVGSNELMRFLDSIGIIADSSALPGRKRDDGQRWFDWTNTPDTAYHPVYGDYQRQSHATGEGDSLRAEKPLGILEIPFTVAGIKAPYDKGLKNAIRRYIDLSFDNAMLRKGLEPVIKDAGYLMMVIHPMQAAGYEVPEGKLVVGGTLTVAKNLKMILGLVEQHGRIPRLMTVGEYAKRELGIFTVEEKGKRVDQNEEREDRDSKSKGGTLRTMVEKKKSARLTTKGGITPDRRRRRDPRKRQG